MGLFETGFWPARWHCGMWSAELGWLHIISDVMIFGAYAAIPLLLLFFVRRRGDVPFPRVFLLFCLFVLACGIGHLIEAIIFWQPVYRLAGVSKAITAVISWVTVIALVPTIPKALRLPGLAKINARLEAEMETRRRAEAKREVILERLRESEERLALALAGSSEGVWDWDLLDDTVYYSRRFRGIVGDPVAAPLWHTIDYWKDRICAPDRRAVEAAIREHLDGRTESLQCEHRIRLPDGSRRWVMLRGSSVRDGTGRPIRLVGSLTDVHSMKTARESLTSHVCHELRSPLADVQAVASGLVEGRHGALDGAQVEAIATIDRHAQRMEDFIDRVIDAARLSDGRAGIEPLPCDLADIVARGIESIQEKASPRGSRIHVEADGDLPAVLADPERIAQVVTNLVDNALEFSPAGSVVRIRVGGQSENDVHFSVTDDGPGIPTSEIEHVFQRLPRADAGASGERKGLGLGLYISREILRQHGGDIRVESEAGRGTTLHCRLPVFSIRRVAEPARRSAERDESALSAIGLYVHAAEAGVTLAVDEPEFRCGIEAIRESIFPARDVVLPPWCSPAGDAAVVVLLVPTDCPGADALVRRLGRRLESAWPNEALIREWQVLGTVEPDGFDRLVDEVAEIFGSPDPEAALRRKCA